VRRCGARRSPLRPWIYDLKFELFQRFCSFPVLFFSCVIAGDAGPGDPIGWDFKGRVMLFDFPNERNESRFVFYYCFTWISFPIPTTLGVLRVYTRQLTTSQSSWFVGFAIFFPPGFFFFKIAIA